LNPSFERSHSFYAHLLSILRRTDEALYHGKKAVELDPENPFTLGLYVQVLIYAEKCEEALCYMKKALAIDPDHMFLSGGLTPIYRCLGDYEKAFEEWKMHNIGLWEKYGVTELLEETFHERGWYAFIEELTRINEGVMAEEIGSRLPMVLFQRYLDLGKYKKAMDYLDIIYATDRSNPGLPYFSNKLTFDKLKGEPRYIEFLKKMNLPLPDD
jgi:tetratricopeptide (TPR) repeat protein